MFSFALSFICRFAFTLALRLAGCSRKFAGRNWRPVSQTLRVATRGIAVVDVITAVVFITVVLVIVTIVAVVVVIIVDIVIVVIITVIVITVVIVVVVIVVITRRFLEVRDFVELPRKVTEDGA